MTHKIHSPLSLRTGPLVLLLAVLLIGCSAEGFDESRGGVFEPESELDFFNNASSSGGAGADATTPPPPETELELKAPEAAANFVFVASSSLDAVAQIDAQTLAIEIIDVGEQPTRVRTRGTINTAAVLNHGSSDVSIIHADPGGGESRTTRVPINPFLNELVMSPDGGFALAYFDEAEAQAGDPLGSFQAVSVVRTLEGREASVTLPVGFHVQSIQFDATGTRAFVITDDFIHPIDLEAAVDDAATYDPGARLELSDDILTSATDREVIVTAGGDFAVVRSLDSPLLRVMDLADGSTQDIPLNGLPTDLDLTPDGSGALAVVRQTQELVFVPLPGAFSDRTLVEVIAAPAVVPVGQALMAADGRHAVIFSTVGDANTLGDFNLEDLTLTPHRLGSGKPIEGAALSEDGHWVFVLHQGDSESLDPVAQSEGFSIVRFGTFEESIAAPQDKFYQTDAETTAALFTGDGGHLFALVPDTRQVVRVDLQTLRHSVDLTGSAPRLIGAMPTAERVYVSQQHDVGRISFIDVISGAVQTVTGFELNSRIR